LKTHDTDYRIGWNFLTQVSHVGELHGKLMKNIAEKKQTLIVKAISLADCSQTKDEKSVAVKI